jgi:hypothetical protein
MAYNESDPFAVPGPGRGSRGYAGGAPQFSGSPGAITSTGGLVGTAPILAYPVFDYIQNTSYIAILDVTNFNCEEPAFYFFRIEDVAEGHKQTLRRIRIRYRDLGVCRVTFAVIGEESQSPTVDNEQLQDLVIGTDKADGRIKTAYASVRLTDRAMQCYFVRDAGKGSLDLISVTLLGTEGDEDEL